MGLSRRRFLKYAGAGGIAVAGFPAIIRRAHAEDTVKVAAMHDRTGAHGIYGKEMDDAAKFVAEEINAGGGVMGKQIDLVAFDTGSNMQNYAQYAQRVATQDKVSVVFGGISSASRETVRPIFDRYKMLYFYNTFYEGGVCDKTVFVNGETPAQMIGPALEYSTAKYNAKKLYTIWADYNYGQICSKWLNQFAKEKGYEVVASEFFPLDVADFSSAITKIQQAKPDMVVSGLVGAAHIGFYRQWPAAGMLGQIPLHSTVFGPWEKSFLKPEEVEGIVTSFHYFQTIDTPANKAFLDKWHAKFGADYAELGTLAVCTYNAFYLWKAAVEKAGSLEREAVIAALESPVSFDGPGGKVTVQPTSHHSFMTINITEVHGGQFDIVKTVPDVEPSDTSSVCDLIANPNQATQYIPEG
ncbi:MAG: transporter substrate-binding protein [Alphaproteobacteria bacterium]